VFLVLDPEMTGRPIEFLPINDGDSVAEPVSVRWFPEDPAGFLVTDMLLWAGSLILVRIWISSIRIGRSPYLRNS
jgi:hypothetical protein